MAAKAKKVNANESSLAFIDISVPFGEGDRKNLDLNALDSHTRRIAENTFVRIDGKILPCQSFRHDVQGRLVLTVDLGHFQITERSRNIPDEPQTP